MELLWIQRFTQYFGLKLLDFFCCAETEGQLISGAGKSLNRRKENSGEKKKTQRLGLVHIGQLRSQDLFPNLNLGFFFCPITEQHD